MAEKYELAEKDYMVGMKYKDIAEKYEVSINTVKSWKTRHKWSKDAAEKSVHTKQKRVHTKKESKEPVVESDELTEKQRLFCIYYIKYFNATKAYQKAYECAYTTTRVEGHRHLTNPNIIEEIDRMKAEQTTELKLDVREVLQKYIDIAFSDITDYLKFGEEEEILYSEDGFPEIDANGNVKTKTYSYVQLEDSDDVDGSIITEVKQGRDGISVKLAHKMKALEMLAKYTDLLSENNKKKLQEEKLKMDIVKLERESNSDTSTEDKLKDYFTALGGAIRDN